MEIEEAEEKLSNMHFNDIVKSYCNKVNDIIRLKAEIKQLKESQTDVVKSGCKHPYNTVNFYCAKCNSLYNENGIKVN